MLSLRSAHELHSFLVPALGFHNHRDAQNYLRTGDLDDIVDSSAVIEPLRVSDRTYVPTRDSSRWRFNTGMLLRKFRQMPEWNQEVLRRDDEPMPEGGYHVCLMMDGKREYPNIQRVNGQSPLLHHLLSGPRDCYAAWGVLGDRERLTRAMDVTTDIGLRRIFLGKAGRGVLYTEEPMLDEDDRLKQTFFTRLTLVEFRILDKGTMVPHDVLRVYVRQISCTGDINIEQLEPPWRDLTKEARDGFESDCEALRPDAEAFHDRFHQQAALLREKEAVYQERVRHMEWIEALDLVEEPWQLAVVIKVHANEEFDRSGFDSDLIHRTDQMLRRSFCSLERRRELWKMFNDFARLFLRKR